MISSIKLIKYLFYVPYDEMSI